FWDSVSLWRPFASFIGRSLLVVVTERSSNDVRLLNKAARGVLTAKQAPQLARHRPGARSARQDRWSFSRRPTVETDHDVSSLPPHRRYFPSPAASSFAAGPFTQPEAPALVPRAARRPGGAI